MADNETTHLGNLFKNRREPGIPDLPLMSVTMNDGLVDRESLERKMDSTLESEGHLLVRAGDIAYNMMRMWQGASGLASHNAIVSPAYIVLAPTTDVDPLFASYWFKSARMIYLFWAYSYGITRDRLRLYYKDFARIPVAIPPKPRQELIGKTLAAWDQACDDIRNVIDARRRRKKGLAQQLLSGNRRIPGFGKPAVSGVSGHATPCGWIPSDWKCIGVGGLGRTYTGLSGKSKEDFGSGSPYIPYLNIFNNTCIDPARMDYVRVQPGERQNEVKFGDIFFTTSSETPNEVGMASVLLEDIKGTYLNSFCFGFRLHDFTQIWPEFAGHLLRGERARRAIARLSQGATRYNLPQSAVLGLNIPLPCLEEQKSIAAVLTTADREIRLLEQKLVAMQKHKKALMQQLLTGTPQQQKSAKNGGKP